MEIVHWIDLLQRSFPLILMGLSMTVQVFLLAASISFSLGLLFGTLCSEELKIPYLSQFIQFITFILRAVPFYIQLLVVYFVFPDIIRVNLDIFSASVIALGACSSGYMCQICRCGINAIPISQWEAAHVLGYNKVKTLLFIIFPQMFRNVLPALNNEVESILKSTSILSSIGMLELTRIGMNIVSRELQYPLTIYSIVASFYVALSLIINFGAKRLERKMSVKVRAQ